MHNIPIILFIYLNSEPLNIGKLRFKFEFKKKILQDQYLVMVNC